MMTVGDVLKHKNRRCPVCDAQVFNWRNPGRCGVCFASLNPDDHKPREVYWAGSNPTKCDLCHKFLEGVFIDGKTVYGPWGILCPLCHSREGCGLGTGRGQEYHKQTDGQWLKVKG